MKIDILTPLQSGGPQKWGDDLALALQQSGIQASNSKNIRSILNRIIHTNSDLIHTTLPLFIQLQGKKTVLTIKGDYRKEGISGNLLFPLSIQMADAITVPSVYLKNQLGIDKAIVIPNGIQFDKSTISEVKRSGKLRLVTVTGFHFWDKAKGVLELLQILNKLKSDQYFDFEFIVLGYGRYLDKIKAAAKAYPVPVQFIGYHPNPREFILQCDLFLYYSMLDSFGIAILEAMACQLPIVVNNHPPFYEILGKHSPECIAQNNEDYLEKVRNYLLNSGQGRVQYELSRFDWKEITKSFVDIYSELLPHL